jgi:hypothetical protein
MSWEFDFKGFDDGIQTDNEAEPIIEQSKTRRRTVALKQRLENTMYRRAFSESRLMDAVGMELKEGDQIHCITAGDVDGLSYLKLMLRHQDLEYCLLSTWCMANDDVLQIEEWIEQGKIKKMDVYVGEIFPGSYAVEHRELERVITPEIGRICVFKNHSKIFAGHGDKFYFGIQTSANVNTNPRTENGCITISKEIFDFYKDYFDGIISFEKKINR